MNRPSWDEYFMGFARQAALRGNCNRLRVGAIIVKDKRVLSTGYNGAPPHASTCEEVGHLMIDGHCRRTVHAERNAIAHAAKHGVSIDMSTVYCTHRPCLDCAVLMAASGVVACVYEHEYGLTETSVYKRALPTYFVMQKLSLRATM